MTNEESAGQENAGQETSQENEGKAQDGKGIKSKLTDAQKEMLASKSRGGVTSQSIGHNHKPTHASGKQGPAQKKVRW
jgi:hypothetical protein